MFALLALSATLFTTLVRADVTPLAPAPGDVFNEGSTCHIAWTPDKTGTWKTTSIELMTGNNLNMVHLTTVTTVDGTTASTFDYPCPSVTPNSAIYFYQFTSPNSPDVLWTGRFAIADASGNTVPPAQNTQPNGDAIPWGTGALTDPSTATPPPPYRATNGTNGTSSAVPGGSSSAIPSSSSSSFSTQIASFTTTDSPSSSSSANSSSSAASATGSSSANGAVGGLVVDARVWRSAVALGAAAVTFAVFL
jgi:hypothetical protein